jgi:hypothetical protein
MNCSECSGTPFPPYIEFLISKGRETIAELVESRIQHFLESVNATFCDGVTAHVAKDFAILFAGASLAIKSGVLPWKNAFLLNSLSQSFEDARSAMKAANPLSLAKKILSARLADSIKKRTSESCFDETQAAGFKVQKEKNAIYVVHEKAFREWFDTDLQVSLIRQWLADKNLLVTSRSGGPGKAPTRNRRWPSGKNVRSIVFWEPFAARRTR